MPGQPVWLYQGDIWELIRPSLLSQLCWGSAGQAHCHYPRVNQAKNNYSGINQAKFSVTIVPELTKPKLTVIILGWTKAKFSVIIILGLTKQN